MTHHILVVSNFLQKPIAELTYSISKAITDISLYRRRRAVINQTIKELSNMTDRDLADIGICRGDIEDVARGVYDR